MQTMLPPSTKAATINLPPQPQYEITDEDKARQKRISEAWKAYNGDLPAPLQKMPGQPDDNVLSNRMQAIVDRGVDFLFGKELEITCEEDAPPEAQDFLNSVWGRKETRIPLLQKLAMNGAMASRAFLRIVPSGDAFRLVALDPAAISVQTMPQDCEVVTCYCIEYCSNEKSLGLWQQVYYREEIAQVASPDMESADGDGNPVTWSYPFGYQGGEQEATWTIQHWSRVGERGPWTPAGEPIAWNYPFPPIFSCQNLPKPNDFWGIPDLTPDLIGVNNSLNLVQSDINRILKIYGHPILYATGTGEQVIDIKPGKIIGLPTSESKIMAVSIASDVANALSFAGNLRSDIDEQSSVPSVATGRIAELPRGNMSGIAIELMFMPILKKTDKKRCTFGELIIDVSKALLVLAGMSGDIDITLNWQNPLPSDDLPALQAALIKQQLGVSKATVLRQIGEDPDEEAELSAAEDADTMTKFSRGQGMPPTPPQQMMPGGPQQGESPFLGRGQ